MRLLIFLMLILLSSCATIIRDSSQELDISSDLSNSKLKVKDTTYTLPAKIKIERSRNDLPVTLINDTLTKNFTIRSSVNRTALYWNLLGFYLYPALLGTDLLTEEGYYYNENIYLNSNDTTGEVLTPVLESYRKNIVESPKTEPNSFNLTVSVPVVNNFYLDPVNNPIIKRSGFYGLSAGLEYFYTKNNFLNLSVYHSIDEPLPIPAESFPESVTDKIKTYSLNLTHNTIFNRFSIGAGVHFSHNLWIEEDYSFPRPDNNPKSTLVKKNNAAGPTFSLYYFLNRNLTRGSFTSLTFTNFLPVGNFIMNM